MRLQATTSGHRYHIEIVGAGEPLLLLHGFSGDNSSWRRVADSLGKRWRIIMLDCLGHGASDKPREVASYHMEAIAADIISLLDQLKIVWTHLLGYSMGGRLALHMALTYPERLRSLILESASPGLADESERAQRRRSDAALADRIQAQGIATFIDYWERLPLWASQAKLPFEVREAQRQQRLRNSALGLANSLRGAGAGAQPNLWSRLATLRMPALLLVGEQDAKFRRINREMAARMPGARLRHIPAAGHNTHLENASAFCTAVDSFLQGLTDSSMLTPNL